MVFKRYISKHGKKLGPYYYENIRAQDGKVKTVYVGTNPHHHPRHRIRKPLIFLISALVLILILGSFLFFLENKSYLVKKIKVSEPDFDVDQILLKVLVKSSESLEKQVRVMAIGNEQAGLSLDIYGLKDLVKVSENSFTINPGQTKIINLDFYSVINERGIEQQPGIYVGKLVLKSKNAAKEIPIVMEIESKNVLFDMNLNPIALERKILQGSDTTLEVRLYNLQGIESANVDVDYFVKDMDGNTILTESETVVVKTQASFYKTISIPKRLKPGPYVFAAQSKFGNSIGTASYMFEVVSPEAETTFVQFCKNSVMCMSLSLTTILLIFALTAYFYFFIGSYLYDKVTGMAALPLKGKKEEEVEETDEKKQSRKLRKILKLLFKSSAELAANNISRAAKLYAKANKLYLKLENDEKDLAYAKLNEVYNKISSSLKQKEEADDLRKKERQEKWTRLQEEKKKLSEARRKKIREFFHKIGIRKTSEEKKQIALQREKENQESLKRAEDLKRQEEIAEKQKAAAMQKDLKQKEGLESKRVEEEKNRLEYQRKKEELELQKMLEEQKRQAETSKEMERQRKKMEAEEEREKGVLNRKADIERQRQDNLHAKKFDRINDAEENAGKKKSRIEGLHVKINSLESGKRKLASDDNRYISKIRSFDNDIISIASQIEELILQKNILKSDFGKNFEDLKQKINDEHSARKNKLDEIKSKVDEKEKKLLGQMEIELKKANPKLKKSTEKWKRLEIKAQLKIEEQKRLEEIKETGPKKYDTKIIEKDYNNKIKELAERRSQLEKSVEKLKAEKRLAAAESNKIQKAISDKDKDIGNFKEEIDKAKKDLQQSELHLSRVKSELGQNNGIFGVLASGLRRRKYASMPDVSEIGIIKEKEQLIEGKSNFFKGLFEKKQGTVQNAEGQKRKREFEDLKKEINEMGLINLSKEEKSRSGKSESLPSKTDYVPEEKQIFKNKKLEKFYKRIDEIRQLIEKNDIERANYLYMQAREDYTIMEYSDKKEAYTALMDLYNKLSK